MKINRSVAWVSLLVLLTGCSAERAIPPRPASTQSAPTPAPRPVPAPAAVQAPADWRDEPLTPGTWRYGAEGSATAASFVSPEGATLFALTCHRERGALLLTRAGRGSGPVPASLVTTYGARPFSMSPVSVTDPTLDLSLQARDPALDEMAFSRGRIAIEVNGLPTLYLPAWAEIGRVIEDCR